MQAPTVVVMGVSGCGKSTIGIGLAKALGIDYLEGDDLHSPENVARMRAGIALTDEQRRGWLEALSDHLARAHAQSRGLVVSCSALKRSYRDILRRGAPQLRLVYLHGDRALLAERTASRKGHYMPASLLDSQLATLEPPGDDEHVLACDLALEPQVIVQRAAAWLGGPETATAGADKGKPT